MIKILLWNKGFLKIKNVFDIVNYDLKLDYFRCIDICLDFKKLILKVNMFKGDKLCIVGGKF